MLCFDRVDDAKDSIKDTWNDAKDSVRDAKDSVKDSYNETKDSIRHSYDETNRELNETIDNAKRSWREAMTAANYVSSQLHEQASLAASTTGAQESSVSFCLSFCFYSC